MVLFTVNILAGSANAGYADPNQFWARFREAVLDNDISTIISLTHFPFKVRGTDDSDPVLQYNKEKFPHIFKKLINQKEEFTSSDGKLVSKTMLQLIKDKKRFGPKELIAKDFLRIYDFEFIRINGSWFFTFGYLDDETP
jgi:uncharacterized membrane protein YvbJ